MQTYARVIYGEVAEIIQPFVDPGGREVPIEERFVPEFVAQMINITDIYPMPEPLWTYDGVVFSPPTAHQPTPEEVLVSQSSLLSRLKAEAEAQKVALTNRIGVLNDSIELEMATDEEVAELPVRTAQLKAWKTYAVLLGRVTGQAGWPPEVVWPVKPAEGMDLSTSAISPEVV